MSSQHAKHVNAPILYSFRRCPYAMRARLALWISGNSVILREVELRNKPIELLLISPQATVPVLQLPSGDVITESLDIMQWALRLQDPEAWLNPGFLTMANQLITENDSFFKASLDRYKYADRYPEQTAECYRQQGERFLIKLEQQLSQNDYLCGDKFSLADAAIAPFIRQFAAVDSVWFKSSPYKCLRDWLQDFVSSNLFQAIMIPYSPWQPAAPEVWFGEE